MQSCLLRRMQIVAVAVIAAVSLSAGGEARALETVAECQEYLRTGKYADCLTAATAAIADRSYGEEWPIMKAQCELLLGKYADSLATVTAGLERYSWSVRLRMLEHDCALANGDRERAGAALAEIERQVSTAAWRYTDADDLTVLGQAALALGADPKDVQEGFFERARRNYANRPDGFVAAGRLALSKGDVAFAAELLTPAAKEFPDNPEVLFLLSEALRTADREQSTALLQKSLEINPQYVPALLRVVEQQIDGEAWDDAESALEHLLSINPHQPDALTLQAVIQHMQNDEASSLASLDAAQQFSGRSARVLHLMGRKLSQKYRFAEGAAWQRKALEADAEFHDARIQLAQDLLRLGQEAEGWEQAELAHQADGYNTTLFNLLKLKDSLDRFTTVHSEHFEVRMETGEAAVYGARVVELLEQAWSELTPRYEFTPETPVYVEIYPRVDDFAVRTFGIPDVAGFLGVCFGRVITANSPASRRDTPTNWESVLWHEFCHVITLQKTGNRIPRWLSEGISVYEERRRDSRWGQRMNADYRDRILAGRITPVAELSSAFLKAESGDDLMFAYYESSMVVEHLVTLHGLPALNAVLSDLNDGVLINDALDRHAGGLGEFEESFNTFLGDQALEWATGVEFDGKLLAGVDLTSEAAVEQVLQSHPKHFVALLAKARVLVSEQRMDEAVPTLRSLIELVPDDDSTDGPRRMMASVYRATNQPEDEAAILSEHLERTADDLDAALRLQELSESLAQPDRVLEQGKLVAAIDPFQVSAAQRTATAAESLQQIDVAREALLRLRQLLPDDAARINFRLAKLLRQSDAEAARRHVLLALEQAPRYRDAHRLLLDMQEAEPAAK